MKGKIKNAPLEASNVAVLLEHIPIGATRSIHSLQVKRVEADHYSIAGGPVIDLVDAMAQIGSYSGKHSNPKARKSQAELLAAAEKKLRAAAKKQVKAKHTPKARKSPDELLAAAEKKLRAAAKKSNPRTPTKRVPLKGLSAAERAEELAFRAKAQRERQAKMEARAAAKLRNPGYYPTVAQWNRQFEMTLSEAENTLEEKQDAAAAQLLAEKAREALNGARKELIATKGFHAAQGKPKEEYEKNKERIEHLEARIAKLGKMLAKKSNPAAKFERGKPAGGGHREERGYFYEVLNSAGTVVALTTSKAEAQDVCNNPKQLGLPKGEYMLRHIGGKSLVPTTEAGTRARRVK